ncbi:MAG: hypothetical protein Q8P67_16710, partial [archaeon]|nr:hypothetical protein [archaeon]
MLLGPRVGCEIARFSRISPSMHGCARWAHGPRAKAKAVPKAHNKAVPAPTTVQKTPGSLLPALHQQLEKFRERRAFNPESWVRQKTLKFLNYMSNCGLRGAVVNVSGGVDSAVVLGLCCYAQKTSPTILRRVVGVAQPIHSTKAIMDRAYLAASAFNAQIITVDQTDLHSALHRRVEEALSIHDCDDPAKTDSLGFSRGQLRSYMRTPVGYYVAQLLSSYEKTPSIVMGTGNYDE